VSAADGTAIGEHFVGEGPELAHVNVVLGARGTPHETAWTVALATPRAGHVPFLVAHRPGLLLQPPTVFVNKAPITSERHGELTWGAAQAGVAEGVRDALRTGDLPVERAGELLLIAAVWVNPDARDEALVYTNNREATARALARAVTGEPSVQAVLAAPVACNAYFDAAAHPTEVAA
jgi:5,6,7,8-tetrahydromethanopterin hydro-lyase